MKGIQQRTYLIIILLCFCLTAKAQSLIFNEIMHSNVTGIMDDLNEFPDSWVELYNSSDDYISVNGLRIGTSEYASNAYTIYDTTRIPPHGFYIIYCDKGGINNHADFRIESDEQSSLYLFAQDYSLIDFTNIPKMLAPDISYGRRWTQNQHSLEMEYTDDWGYLMHTTVGYANDSIISDKLLGNPHFSIKGGSFSNPITIKVTSNGKDPDETTIRYTLDGSEPTSSSVIIPDSLTISSTTIIRAKEFADGWHSPLSKTHSYIFHEREVTLPIISIVTDSSYLYDDEIGILVLGKDNNLRKKWRRPINFEYFSGKRNEADINQVTEAKVGGASSYKLNPIKPLMIYANHRFGKKRLDCKIWKTQKPKIKKNKSLFLRSSGQDCQFSYLRDAASQLTFSRYVNIDWQAYQPSIYYINGKYAGIINIRERTNGDHVWANYNKLENIDMIKNWHIVQEGDTKEYDKLMSYVNDANTPERIIDSLVDVECFINLLIINTLQQNTDYFNNNVVWRERVPNAKWRTINKDIDFSWAWDYTDNSAKSYKDDYLIKILRNNDPRDNRWNGVSTKLFRKIISFDKYKDNFIDRFCVYLGDFARAEITNKTLDSMASNIEYEIPYLCNISHILPTTDEWYSELDKMKNWMTQRVDYIPQDLHNIFELGDTFSISFNNRSDSIVKFTFNDIPLVTNSLKGKYFKERNFTLRSNKRPGNWEIKKNYELTSETEYIYNSDSLPLNITDSELKSLEITFSDKTNDNGSKLINNLSTNIVNESESIGIYFNNLDTPYDISVYNILGQKIYDNHIFGFSHLQIPVNTGDYIVVIKSNNKKHVQKCHVSNQNQHLNKVIE